MNMHRRYAKPRRSARRSPPERYYVSYPFVADESRRKGIGRRLLDVMEAEAKRAGFARLVARYKAVNVATARGYEAAGFRPDQHIVSKPIGG
jgi:GNAT superfamily N-acetyltransferase